MCAAALRPAVLTIPETDPLGFRASYRVVVGVGGGASDNPV